MRDLDELTAFIVEAKAKTYVGGGTTLPSCRQASHDIGHVRDGWSYLDSYFGGTDFAGQEVVWDTGTPIWAMNYFGRIILPDLIDGARAGAVIKAALASMYAQHGRFLGGMRYAHEHGLYVDDSDGDTAHFRGREVIIVDGREAYEWTTTAALSVRDRRPHPYYNSTTLPSSMVTRRSMREARS